jgi:hypothetical protein
MIRNRKFLFICIIILIYCLCAGSVADQASADIGPEEIRLITSALLRLDSTSESSNSADMIKIITLSQQDLIKAKTIISQHVPENSRDQGKRECLIRYTSYWINFTGALSLMLEGSDQKMAAYKSLVNTSPDRFRRAYVAFNAAEQSYSSAEKILESDIPVIRDLNTDIITTTLPEVTIPDRTVHQEIINRLHSNILICQAYALFCQAEMIKSETGNNKSPGFIKNFQFAENIMKNLSTSPYTGSEARQFTNLLL